MTSAPTTRDRVVETAARLTTDLGWAHVTMARLADEAGVSRQTVYNEVGSRAGLAEAMIAGELARFLGIVTAAFDAHPDDIVAAISNAAEAVLEHAADNTLLHAIVSATHGADTELLPLLTTNSEPLLHTAIAVIRDRVVAYDPPIPPERLDAAIDLVVRLVLSHVMQPSGTPKETAADLAWVARRVLL